MYFLVLLSALLACAAGVPFNTTKPIRNGRIVDGSPTRIENQPYQVALLQHESFFCSGSIISPTCVVTAASCVTGKSSGSITIRAGSTYFQFGGSTRSVTGGFYHSNYDPYNNYNNDYDVAVLRVDSPFIYSDSVRNIELQEYEVNPRTNVIVSGWDSSPPGVPFIYELQEAVAQIIDDNTCRDRHPFQQYFTNRMICTGYPCASNGPCDGNGGGPLTNIHFPRKLVGIVSSQPWPCGNPSNPAIYTKVSAVRNWILNYCSDGAIPFGITKADPIL